MWPHPGPVLHPWLEAGSAWMLLATALQLNFSLLSHSLQGCSKKRIYLKQKTIDSEIHDIWIYPASHTHSCNFLHFHPSHRTCSAASENRGAAPQVRLALTAGQQSPWQPKLGAALKIDLINKFIGIQEKYKEAPYWRLCQGSSDISCQKSIF